MVTRMDMTRSDPGRRRMPATAAIAIALTTALLPATATAQEAEDTTRTTAIVGADVIPLSEDGVLETQTVLVEDGRIAAIGPADEVVVPDSAERIDGEGHYLVPGFANGHFHVSGDPVNLDLALANGQTTVTAFNASPEDLELAAEVASGERFGPRIITGPNVSGLLPVSEYAVRRVADAAAPLFDTGILVEQAGLTFDADTAERFVRQAAEAGADFIKINVFVNREVFDAVVATADELGLPVQGHVSGQIGLEHFIESGAHVHHFSEVAPYLGSSDIQGIPVQKWSLDLVDEKLPGLVELMVANDQWFTPTVNIGAQIAEIWDDPAAVAERPELRYVSPAMLRAWENPETNLLYANVGDGSENVGRGDKVLAFDERLVHDLYEAGVPLIAGEDAGAVPWSVPGFELATELELFVDYGMSPQDALRSASSLVAEFYGQDDEWGTIEVGKAADLILLGGDPLADISNVRDIRGVMRGGVWLDRSDLQAKLDEIAAGYEAQATIELEPYASTEMGFSGIAPAGWVELDPGVLTRSDPASDPTFFVQLVAPLQAAEELVGQVLGNFGAVELGDPLESIELGSLTWGVFMPEGELGIVVARSEDESMAYLLAVAAAPDEIEALTASVLRPAVEAFAPDA
jgi:imidazolonepropionase-like amidohydrolase